MQVNPWEIWKEIRHDDKWLLTSKILTLFLFQCHSWRNDPSKQVFPSLVTQCGTFFTPHNLWHIYIIKDPHFVAQIPHFVAQMCHKWVICGTFCNYFIILFQPKSNLILLILYQYTSIKIISCKSNQFLVSNYLFHFFLHILQYSQHIYLQATIIILLFNI